MTEQKDYQDKVFEMYQAPIAACVERCRKSGEMEKTEAPDGAEIYAYGGGDDIHWGVNGPHTGFNILRGIRAEDDSDSQVM